MGVPTSEQTNLHTDSLPNTLNTNKSVPAKYNNDHNACIAIIYRPTDVLKKFLLRIYNV